MSYVEDIFSCIKNGSAWSGDSRITSDIPRRKIQNLQKQKLSSVEKRKLKVTVIDMQPIDPPVGGGRIRLLGLYGGFDAEKFTVTYVGSYDWPGEKYRDHQLTKCLREIDVPLSDTHFQAHNELAKKIGKSCIDVSFPLLGHLSEAYISTCIKHAKDADVVVFSHPWLYKLINPILDRKRQLIVYDSQNHEGMLRCKIYGDKIDNDIKSLCLSVIENEYKACIGSDAILTCSVDDSSNFAKFYAIDNSKLVLMPNGVFASKVHPCKDLNFKKEIKKKLKLPAKVCCFVGSNYEPNIEAVKLIIEAASLDSSICFVIIGGVSGTFDSKAIPNNVLLVGFVSEEVKQLYLWGSDIAVNPMMSGSGTNVKMFDFMAAGLPIVTTEVGARGINNEAGNLYETCDVSPTSLVAKINNLFANESRRDDLSKYSRSVSEAKYSFERISYELGYLLEQKYKKEVCGQQPFFTVIIPTYNRKESLIRLLKSLDEQSCKDYEVVIVDQSYNALNSDYILRDNYLYLHTMVKGAAKARNTGARLANGKILAYIDDDCQPESDWLEKAKKYFDDPNVVGVEGRIYPDVVSPEYRVVTNHGVEGLGFMTANLFVRKESFDTINGFDELFDNPHFREDTDLGWRLLEIGKVPFAPEVRVLHPSHLRSNKRESLYERNKFYIQDPLLMKKHPKRFVKLFVFEAKYNDPVYWQYFKLGMDRYHVPVESLLNILHEAKINKEWIPVWAGGNFDVGLATDFKEKNFVQSYATNGISDTNKSLIIKVKFLSKKVFYSILSVICFGRCKQRFINKKRKAEANIESLRYKQKQK